MMKTDGSVAFFDLDRTLIKVNSARMWIAHERQEGRISRRQTALALYWLVQYGLGASRIETALEQALRSLEGIEEAAFEARTRQWFDSQIASTVQRGAWEALERHRRLGHPCVLLTSTSPYVARPAVELLGLDHFLCSRFEVVDGRFTGRPILPFCFGEGKVVLARPWASAQGFSLDHSYFYSDSRTDLPMLLAVGHPRVVNPDLRLRREALRRGWEIQYWD